MGPGIITNRLRPFIGGLFDTGHALPRRPDTVIITQPTIMVPPANIAPRANTGPRVSTGPVRLTGHPSTPTDLGHKVLKSGVGKGNVGRPGSPAGRKGSAGHK